MFSLIAKHLRKMTHRIIICPWNAVLFMAKLFIYLFKCSLYVVTINVIIRKLISNTKVWLCIDVLLL